MHGRSGSGVGSLAFPELVVVHLLGLLIKRAGDPMKSNVRMLEIGLLKGPLGKCT